MKIKLLESGNSVRKLPKNIIENDKRLFLHEENYAYKETYIIKKKNIYIFNGILISIPQLRYFKKYTFFGDKTFIERIIRIIKNYLLSKSTNVETIDKGMWFTDHKSHVYFHWMLDSLQRAKASENFNQDYPLLVQEDFYKKEFVKESLKILNFKYLVLKTNHRYKINNLKIVSKTAKTGNYNEQLLSSLITNFKEASIYTKKDKKHDQEKNYFIFRSENLPRSIFNISDLNILLKKYNYEFIQFEKHNFIQKIEKLKNCKNLVGVFGSGLTNMLFMNKNTNIVEIREVLDSHNNAFFSLASALNINYYYSFFEYHEDKCLVDIESLEKVFELIVD